MARALDNDLFSLALGVHNADPLGEFDELHWARRAIQREQDQRDSARDLYPQLYAADPRQCCLDLEFQP